MEDLNLFMAGVRMNDATDWEKTYKTSVDGASVYEIKVTAPGAPPAVFYMHVAKKDDERAVTLLTTEKPPESDVKFVSTTTFTKQMMKSPLQEIYVSDNEEALSGQVASDSWDKKVGPTVLFCRVEHRGAKVGSQLKMSWKAELPTDWGPEMVELGPFDHTLSHASGWITFGVTHGETPFPAGKHRIEVYMGEKRLGMKEFSIAE